MSGANSRAINSGTIRAISGHCYSSESANDFPAQSDFPFICTAINSLLSGWKLVATFVMEQVQQRAQYKCISPPIPYHSLRSPCSDPIIHVVRPLTHSHRMSHLDGTQINVKQNEICQRLM